MIKLVDNHEALVDLRKVCKGFVFCLDPDAQGRPRIPYLRKSVAEKLIQAKKMLPEGMTFIIRDAWRSVDEQKEIYRQFIKRFSERYPNESLLQVKKRVNVYVAAWEGQGMSGHLTGGAVDIRLMKNGRRVPMRSKALSYEENADPHCSRLSKALRNNREIMYRVLESVGFYNNEHEFWHWSYGDVWWARGKGKKETLYCIADLTH